MRLQAQQTHTIKEQISAVFGADAAVWLFGSQINDDLTGGDVDIFVDTPQPSGLKQIVKAKALLTHTLGLPVDIVLRAPGRDPGAIAQIAQLSGQRLQ